MFKATGIIVLILLTFTSSFAQSIDQIKSNREEFLWGEGVGRTLESADNQALKDLISQISVSVQSSFDQRMTEIVNEDGEANLASTVESVINTYSDATLHSTERIIISDEPDARILRYIKREQVYKVFENRKNKILAYCQSAYDHELEHNPAEALRYYYWSYVLLISHPNANNLYFSPTVDEKYLLMNWLPVSMRRIFNDLQITVKDIDQHDTYARLNLNILHQNIPVEHFDYIFWDGRDWSTLISAKDGLGIAEVPVINHEMTGELRIRGEYLYKMEAHIDKELDQVMSKITPFYLKEREIRIDLKNEPSAIQPGVVSTAIANEQMKQVKTNLSNQNPQKAKMEMAGYNASGATLFEEANPQKESVDAYLPFIQPVLEAIQTKSYESVENYFTADGYDTYKKLICYGHAEILDPNPTKAYSYQNKKYVRSIPMVFSFENNTKRFVENVVFCLDGENKIEGLSFALSQKAFDDIQRKDVWELNQRMAIVTFLENYKTAYALERIDYIQSIFDDDALIIVGNVVKKAPAVDDQFRNHRLVQYNKFNKTQYINRLQTCFLSNEYINLKFEESFITRSGGLKPVFGLQIKQSYYSSNYGDVGYLFLLVDLQQPLEPIIHVRTWQPEIELNEDGSRHIYGLGDF